MEGGYQAAQTSQKTTGTLSKDSDDHIISILTTKKERKDLKACLMNQLKLTDKISTFLAQSLEQNKKDQTFVRQLFVMIQVSSTTGDDRKDIKKELQQINKKLQHTIKKTTVKFLLDHLNKGEFQQAKSMILQSCLDQYSSKTALQFIDETAAIQKKSKELFEYIYKDTSQYQTDNTALNLKTASQQLNWITEQLRKRYCEFDVFLKGITQQNFLKNRLSKQPTISRLSVKLNYYLSILSSLNQEISFFEAIKDSYERNIGAFEEFNSKLKRHKPKPSLTFRTESWKQEILGFESRFSQLIVEVEKLRSCNKQLQAQIQLLRSSNGSQKEISESRTSLASKTTPSPSAMKTNSTGSNSCVAKRLLQKLSQLKEKEGEKIKKLQEKFKELTSENQRYEKQAKEKGQTKQKLEQQKMQIDDSKKNQQTLIAQHQLSNSQLKKLTQKFNSLEKDKEALEKSIQRLKTQAQQPPTDAKPTERFLRNNNENSHRIITKPNKLQLQALQQQDLYADYKEFKNQIILKQKEQLVRSLPILCQQKQKSQKSLTSQLDQAHEKLLSLQKCQKQTESVIIQLANLRAEKNDLQRQLSEAINNKAIQHQMLSNQCTQYRSRIDTLQRKLKVLNDNNRTLQSQIREAEVKAKRQASQAAVRIEKALESSRKQLSTLKGNLSQKQQQCQRLISLNQDIQKRLNSEQKQGQSFRTKTKLQKQKLSDDILRLQTQLTDRDRHLQKSRKQIADLTSVMHKQPQNFNEEKIAEWKRQEIKDKQQKGELKAKIERLSQQLVLKQRELGDLRIINSTLKASKDKYQELLHKEKIQMAEIRKEQQYRVSNLTKNNNSLVHSQTELSEKINNLQLRNSQLEQEKLELENSITNITETQKQLQDRIAELESEKAALEEETGKSTADHAETLKQLQERIAELESEKTALEEETGKSTAQHAETLKQLQERIAQLEAEKAVLQEEIGKSTAQHVQAQKQLQERIRQLQKIIHQQCSQENQLQNKLNLESEIIEIKFQQQQIEDLNQKVKQMTQKTKSLEQKVFRLQKTNKILMIEKEAMIHKYELLEFELRQERSKESQRDEKEESMFLVGIEDVGNSFM